jgi:hypothetical protein
MIELIADTNLRSYAVAIALCAAEFEDQPGVVGGCHIFPKLGWFSQSGYHHVQLAVIIEISKGCTAVRTRHQKIRPGGR